ncbi:MAG: hypothetical protein IT559_08820 [Alphaproteobacteria bacterium]|nr:hypothetical protein [Alphaproteobacteria bacterium]
MSDEEPDILITTEVVDRVARRALKQKLRQEAKEKSAHNYGEIDEAIQKGKFGTTRKAQKKLKMKIGAGVLGVALLGWAIYTVTIPAEAGMSFGICRVFLENTVRFPQELRLSTVEDLRPRSSAENSMGGVRLWYTQVDSFGQYRMENIECYFKNDETLGAIVDKIFINRREVDGNVVADFNKILPVVLAYPPDLKYPPALSDSLQGLQIQTDMYRKTQF